MDNLSKNESKRKRNRLSGEVFPGLGDTMGSSTGEADRSVEPGGWAGTDDATSTSPSDEMGNPSIPEEEQPYDRIVRDFDESIQLDEERQEDDAEIVDEKADGMRLNDHEKKFRSKR